MQRILFVAILLLSLMVCLTSPVWAGGLDDAQAGEAAFSGGNDDEAIRLFTKAIESGELSPENLCITYNNRASAWHSKGDSDKAIADWTKVIEINPQFTGTYYISAYYSRGVAWYYKGDSNKAIADLTKAIEINPQHASAYHNRGLAWGKKGDYDKAIADYTKAIEIYPQFDSASYYNRGNAWGKKGDYDKAIADYTKAIEIDPKYASVYNGLAWLMATCPGDRYRDGKRAVELAEKAVALKDDANFLDTLAAAYAEAGRFQEAITTQERAITKLKQEGGTKDLPGFEEHLSSYKAGKPWREK
jgi:tetratricopeptide (TPR) repeat protein